MRAADARDRLMSSSNFIRLQATREPPFLKYIAASAAGSAHSCGLLIMTQQLRMPALLCLVVMASAVSAQDAGLFEAPKRSNFEALLDKLPKVGTTTSAGLFAVF